MNSPFHKYSEHTRLETQLENEAVATDLLSNLACQREKRIESREKSQRVDALIERLHNHEGQ